MNGDRQTEPPQETSQDTPSFSRVQAQAPPPPATQPGLPLEHSEFFRKPSEMASFTMPPSIIAPPASTLEKPNLSNFASIINTHRTLEPGGEKKKRSRRPSQPKGKKRASKKSEGERYLDINDTKVKKKIKAHQFDSEAEDIRDYLPLDSEFAEELCFLEKEHVPTMSKKITKSHRKVFDLLRFVKDRDSETRDVKTYACKYCPKVFVKRAALGGHTAKNHPHQSDSYRLRQESLKNRRIERERFDYFKNIKK